MASSPRTYFLNRLPSGELARILLGHERFFLENVGDMNGTLAAIEAHCREHGLTSRVCKKPYNPGLSAWDALLLIPAWTGLLAATALSLLGLRGPRADLVITQRSNSLLEIRYRTPLART
ncbi:hypothetical protein JL37_15950 [Achromobacter sp. RTa]|uniref:hypothetical protein n=1 Tax=Achromobacter sp. RTa TaxID=1532557 RepID=UPI00050E109C|nr:hypothetical protein [Achromobacter sp. RTa]KGD92142.1 hypothetical protein JL37_15950 [Achromobacter sp. RTa]